MSATSASHEPVLPKAEGVQRRLLVLVLYALGLSAIFASTLSSMIDTWLSSETFTHGILVAPISLWLAWRLRDVLVPLLAQGPSPVLLIPIPFLALIWLAGKVVSVQLVMQLAYTGMLVSGLAAILGTAAAKKAAFPLGFLFLAVPMGIGLEPPMMDFTAEYTVKLIQLTGIPVYQEGRFFQLPSGSWSVVEACSGVRYLIASFTLGLLFAHISYRTLYRKLAFVAASIIVPIIANVLRAYLIVMLGHLSNMELATGVDHLIYGWIFFGLVMLLLFWVGSWWAENTGAADRGRSGEPLSAAPAAPPSGRPVRGWLTLTGALLLAGMIPATLAVLRVEQRAVTLADVPSLSDSEWQCEESHNVAWNPRDGRADRRFSVSCESPETVQVVADQYLRQEQGREVADYFSGLKGEDDDRWRVVSDQKRDFDVRGTSALAAQEARLRRKLGNEEVLVAAWYLVNARSTASPVAVKLQEGIEKLRGNYRLSARVFIAVPIGNGDVPAARTTLERFIRARAGAVNAALSATAPNT